MIYLLHETVGQINKKPTTWCGGQNAAPLKFDLKPSEAAFLEIFVNFEKCRPEEVDDVISGEAVE